MAFTFAGTFGGGVLSRGFRRAVLARVETGGREREKKIEEGERGREGGREEKREGLSITPRSPCLLEGRFRGSWIEERSLGVATTMPLSSRWKVSRFLGRAFTGVLLRRRKQTMRVLSEQERGRRKQRGGETLHTGVPRRGPVNARGLFRGKGRTKNQKLMP